MVFPKIASSRPIQKFCVPKTENSRGAGREKGPHAALAEWEMSARSSRWIQIGSEKS